QAGDDLTVYATNNTTYSVNVAYDIDDIDDSGNKLGTGQGEASFDLESAGLDSARFIQISLTSGSVELDAIEVEPREVVIGINNDKFTVQDSYENHKPRILYNNGSSAITLQAFIPQGGYEISVYDIMGRNVYTLDRGEATTSAPKIFQWNGHLNNGKSCAKGTYMFCIKTSCGKKVVKGLLVR
ncbi:MAG: T9SS type B sorting domain-containing protein, partial [Planctomycetota bacterium]